MVNDRTAAIRFWSLGIALAICSQWTGCARRVSHQERQQMVRVHVFDRNGKLVGPVDSPRLVLSDDEWKKRLAPDQFRILRTQGTERPFCGTLLDNKKEGVYACGGCGLPLFASNSKFNSGTGWPSFFQPIAKENVEERSDDGLGMRRTEILCARCGGHLGHVFDDGPRPTGLRFCLNSESLKFTPSTELASLADPAADTLAEGPGKSPDSSTTPVAATAAAKSTTTEGKPAKPMTTATAVFAGGCFWCTEAAFEQLKGVVDVQSGYAGGTKDTATYERVSTGSTGHAEAIRITYDPMKISYDRLLDVFFDAHDPTQLNRQDNDAGTQYRSTIFYVNEIEERAAQAKIKQLTAAKAFPGPIVTTLEPLKNFYPAEEYHQDYARRHPDQPYIQYHALPKVCTVRDKHRALIKHADDQK
jgi:peptide methionine sulfoxide reductase msrA/msrB